MATPGTSNAASPGSMYAHTGISVVKTSGETESVIWTIDVGI